MRAFGASGAPPLVRAMNLLVDRPAAPFASAARASSGRMLTAVPWAGHTLVGTFQSQTPVEEPDPTPTASLLDTMVDDAASAFPALRIDRAAVRLVHRGLTPAIVRNGRADLLPDPVVIRHTERGTAGLYTLIGVKFTTARKAAETAVSRIAADLGRPASPCRTADALLPFASLDDASASLAAALGGGRLLLDEDVRRHLTDWYGTESADVVHFCAESGLTGRLAAGAPVLTGEIAYAVVHADAVRLSDAVLRRTPLGSSGHPGRDALTRAAEVMGTACGWTPEARAAEVAAVEERFSE
jgi:glycerol-3-phosphate dehydrogenase